MRKGPRPLSVQIGMATSYWPYAFAAQPEAPKQFPEDIENMLRGIRKYQTHDYERPDMQLEEVWSSGEVKIYCIPGHDYATENPAIILVPSLINKAHILDLMPERSMLRFLAEKKINAYLLDWGEPTEDDGQSDIDGVVCDRLVPALVFVQEKEDKPVHALGYCMGGTLLMAAAVHMEDKPASVIMLAAPWDFHAGSQALLNCVKFWAPSAMPTIDEKKSLPVDWMQIVFASLDPYMAAKKFSNFEAMEEGSEKENLFVAVEDWLNDGVDLPANLAQHTIKDWFLKNLPGSGEWDVAGKAINPADINCPVLIIASDKDRLVEYDTATALRGVMKNAKVINPGCGHIGMIAGRHSLEKVWQPLAEWLQK